MYKLLRQHTVLFVVVSQKMQICKTTLILFLLSWINGVICRLRARPHSGGLSGYQGGALFASHLLVIVIGSRVRARVCSLPFPQQTQVILNQQNKTSCQIRLGLLPFLYHFSVCTMPASCFFFFSSPLYIRCFSLLPDNKHMHTYKSLWTYTIHG